MIKWVCKMYYGDKLYSGHYWGDIPKKVAQANTAELQQKHPAFRFELTRY
jgi:hypothetical protein